MNKNFKFYGLIWAILFTLWCVVVFLVRPILPGYDAVYDARFFTAFAFIIFTFIGNLICAFLAFKAENPNRMFLNMPLMTASWSALIAMIISGTVLMFIPNCPTAVAAIVCAVILAFNAISVIKAVWAADAVSKVDDRIKAQTSFMRNLTVDTEGILSRAKSDTVRAVCQKVHDSVRYSDPMSNEALSVIEAKITVKMDELSSFVAADDAEKVKEIADELIILVADRNNKCKGLKG